MIGGKQTFRRLAVAVMAAYLLALALIVFWPTGAPAMVAEQALVAA
ncbi:hypothetical protein ACX80E_06865 [Arthrobacter sp. TMN-49]